MNDTKFPLRTLETLQRDERSIRARMATLNRELAGIRKQIRAHNVVKTTTKCGKIAVSNETAGSTAP